MNAREQLQLRLDLIDSAVVLASLVGYELDEATADQLTDNPVRVPPRPAWLPMPWAGADSDFGSGPTEITAEDVAKATGSAS